MIKRKKKPQEARNCLKCGTPLTGYKRKYCDGKCQRAYEWLKKQNMGVTVSECCESEVRSTVRGNFCKACGEKTNLATIYAIADRVTYGISSKKNRVRR